MKTWKSFMFVLIGCVISFISFYWIMVPNTTLLSNDILHVLLYRIIAGAGAFVICFIVMLIVLYVINYLSNDNKTTLVIASTALKVAICINVFLAMGYIYAELKK